MKDKCLTDLAASGGRWTAISAIASIIIQLSQLAILGRLLSPADFGMMAMMSIVIGLANLLADFGISNFLVQTKNLTGRLFTALFVLCIGGAFCLAGCTVLVSPLVADYYNTPVLASLLPVLGIVVFVTAIGQPFFALLQREMQFKDIAIIEVIAGLSGLSVSIYLALMNHGIWSLIGGQLALSIVKSVMCVIKSLSFIHFKWEVHWNEVSRIVRFGNFQMGERILAFASLNLDKVIVGRMLGDGALGIYSVAYQLVFRPFSILNPVFTRVALPLFSHIQDDNIRLTRGYLVMIRTIALIAFPVYLFMILASDSIVYLLLGSKWADASGIIAILGFLGFVLSLGNPIGSLILAKGRPDLGFYYTIIAVCIYSFAIYMGSNFGVRGVASGFVIAAACVLFPLEFLLRWKLVRMSPWIFLRAIGNIVAGTFIPLIVGCLILSNLMLKSDSVYRFDILIGLSAVSAYFLYMWLTERLLLQKTFQLILKG